jgi:hypothetical protein
MITYEIKGPPPGPFQVGKGIGDFLLIVGPNKNAQFPFVLLDRALIFFASTINWAHARREVVQAPVEKPAGFVAHFSEVQAKTCHAFFQAAGAGDEIDLQGREESMADMLVDFLMALSAREYPNSGQANGVSDKGDAPWGS